MINNNLTDRSFWVKYWDSKSGLILKVKLNYPFKDILKRIISEDKIQTAIELGGFPGYYSIYLKKFYNVKPTLLDYFIHRDLAEKLLVYNDLSVDQIEIIEADLFTYETFKKYDLVLSMGLIEHFDDTYGIIKKHIPFINEGGKLLITIPNFRGVNGWVQRNFDTYNYDKHNINCMDPAFLYEIASNLGLKDVKAYYHGRFSVWLENKEKKSLLTKLFIKAIWLSGKVVTRIIPVESRIFSPYIVLEAKKQYKEI